MKRLLEIVLALNSEKTRLTRKKAVEAIKEKVVDVKSSATYLRLFAFERVIGRNQLEC